MSKFVRLIFPEYISKLMKGDIIKKVNYGISKKDSTARNKRGGSL